VTKREMVKAAIRHMDTGKVPFCIHLAGDAKEKYGQILQDEYLKGDLRSAVDKGILSAEEALPLAMGNHVYCINDKPWWDWYDLPESYWKDFEAPSFLPKTKGIGSYERFEEKIKYVKETTGCYILVMVYGSHFEKANACRGIENFLGDLGGHKEYAQQLLDMIIRKNLVMLENLVSLPGIDGILLGSDWGSQKSLLMSPATWRQMIAPGELKEYELIKEAGKDVWIHSCGNIVQIIPDLIEMGVDVLNPVQPECMDIYALKEQFGHRLTFFGGISTQHTLPYGTVDEVRKETRQVIASMSRGGGYITAPAQEIQADVPIENILALVEEASSFS
jgi:uroporphyrinogen decarboxylase